MLVCVSQRGAADGMNSIIPYGDGDYYSLRPDIGILPPNQGGAIDLDGFFGLHPAAAELLPLYQMGRLAAAHATGVPHNTRSHFDAQALVESVRQTSSISAPAGSAGTSRPRNRRAIDHSARWRSVVQCRCRWWVPTTRSR